MDKSSTPKTSSAQKKKTKNKVVGLFLSIVQTILILALVVIAILSFGTRIPILAHLGFNFFAVISGSMEPKIHTGSLAYVGKYKLEDLKKGDIITYSKSNPDTKQLAVVTHRIYSIDKVENKQETNDNGKKGEKVTITYAIKTKGDANSQPDPYTVEPGEVIGLYQWSIPKLGYVTLFAQTPRGFVAMVVIPAAILVMWEVFDLILYFKKKYETKSQSEIAKLKEQLAKAEAAHAK